MGASRLEVRLGTWATALPSFVIMFKEKSLHQEMQHGFYTLTPGCCCAVETADSVFCFFSTMLLSSVESSGRGRLGPSVAIRSDHWPTKCCGTVQR